MILQTIKGVFLLLATICMISSCGNNSQTNTEQIIHQKISFNSGRDGDSEIYVMNADGSNVVQLTHNDVNDGYPTWSPDGTEIAFHSNRDGDSEIYIMNADGSDQRRVSYDPANDTTPDMSPDGSTIIYYTNRDGNL